MKSTKLYEINPTFAQKNKLPVYFAAKELTETNKAVYLYGQGSLEARTKYGNCFVCGRTLTHPGSMKLGIGPVCLGSELRQDVIEKMSEKEINELVGKVIQDKKIDQWLPKSVIYEAEKTDEEVQVPKDHKMLNRKSKKKSIQKKQAIKVQYQNNGRDAIKILFPFDREIIANVKKIPGRKFHANERPKYWSAPVSVEAVDQLEKMGFEIDPDLLEYRDSSKVSVEDMTDNIKIPGLGGELFPFQAKGVNFIDARNGRALIGDEMGLGKTVQALAWLQKYPKKRPVIIEVPASLKLNWKKEAEIWMDNPNIQILSGTKPTTPIIGDIIIINYDIIQYWVEELQKIKPQVLILDEAHYIKNNKAKRTKASKKLGKNIPHVIALTGTPIVNRPVEILNSIQLIDKSVAPNRWHFLQRYCGAKHNGFGWDFNGASNTQELHEKLTNTILIRRKKKDVLKDLPDKIRSFVPIELDNEKEYQKAENDFINFVRNQTEIEMKLKLEKQLGDMADLVSIDQQKLDQLKEEKASKVNVLTQIEGLKQLAVKGKMKQSINWIRDYLEGDNKLVIMAVHKFVINQLMEEFGNIAVKVDGSVTGEDRQAAVERFQSDGSIKLFIGNIQAAGVGLTLTAASTVAFLELPWTPGECSQAEDRVHRIGQEDSVNIYYLLAQNTIEEEIASLIDKKRKVLDSVLDGKETENESLLTELMQTYKS